MNKPDLDTLLATKKKLHQLNYMHNYFFITSLGRAEFSQVFPIAMVSGSILHINPRLVLPKSLSFSQELHSFCSYFLNNLNREIFIPTAPRTPIMVAKTPNLVLHFLLMARVSFLKWVLAFPHILTLTFFACAQINHPRAVTVYSLSHVVCFPRACTLKCFTLIHDRAGHPTPVALEATCILGWVLIPSILSLETSNYPL